MPPGEANALWAMRRLPGPKSLAGCVRVVARVWWTGRCDDATSFNLETAVEEDFKTRKGPSHPGGWAHGQEPKGSRCERGRGGLDAAVGRVP